MRFVGSLLLIVLLVLTRGAAAHGPGSEPLHVDGVLALSPVESANASRTESFHALGLPIDAGDILQFAWEANDGLGPALQVEIREQPPGGAMVRLYSATEVADSAEIPMAGPGNYLLFADNGHPVAITLVYRFVLLPPTPTPQTDYLPIILLAAAGGVFGIILWLGRRQQQKEEAPEEDREE